MDHIGIDVHKKESQICILSEEGELIEQPRSAPSPSGSPTSWATGRGPGSSSRPRPRANGWPGVWRAWATRSIVADPNFAPMYATRTRKVKTDRRDARALAEACLLGAYRPAHRLSDAQRHVRGRLTVRDALVRTRTRYIAVIRALLRQHGWRVPTGSAEAFIRRVLALPLPGRLLSEVAPLLAVMRQVNQQLAYSDERIEAVARADARVQRLRSVPSVGPVTAAAFVATLDDAERFRAGASGRGLSGPGAPRVELRGGPAARADHQGRPCADALVAGPGGRLDPPLPPPQTEALRAWATASPRAAGRRLPWSRWPAAWRASSTRCCATARCMPRGPCRAAPPRRPSRAEARRVENAKMADFGNTQIAAPVVRCDPEPTVRSRFTRVGPRILGSRTLSAARDERHHGLAQVRRVGERAIVPGRGPRAVA